MKKIKPVIILMLVLSIIGLLVSVYLTATHYAGTTPECSLIAGCETVTTSSYSAIENVPISVFGILFFSAALLVSGMFLHTHHKRFLHLLTAFLAVGAAISLILFYIQIFILDAICMYCVIVDSITIVLFVLVLIAQKLTSQRKIW